MWAQARGGSNPLQSTQHKTRFVIRIAFFVAPAVLSSEDQFTALKGRVFVGDTGIETSSLHPGSLLIDAANPVSATSGYKGGRSRFRQMA